MQDIIYKGLLCGDHAAFYAIDATNLVENAKNTHDMSATCTAALGRTLMGTLLMAMMQKDERYKVSVVIKGGGEAGPIVCVARNNGHVKGYISNPHVELPPKADGKLNVGGAVGKEGNIRVISDLGLDHPYIGETPLVSGEIAEDFAQFFVSSMQQPSMVYLGVHINKDFHVESATGIIIQTLPFCPEEVITKLEEKALIIPMLSQKTKDAGDLRTSLDDMLCELDLVYTQEMIPSYSCDCSKERLEQVLVSLGEHELNDMIRKDDGAELTCHFCNKRYTFTGEELGMLLSSAKSEVIK